MSSLNRKKFAKVDLCYNLIESESLSDFDFIEVQTFEHANNVIQLSKFDITESKDEQKPVILKLQTQTLEQPSFESKIDRSENNNEQKLVQSKNIFVGNKTYSY